MKIEIIDKEGNLITEFNLETNPFVVGETINIHVSNHDKKFWNVNEVNGDYLILKIEHFLRQDFLLMQQCSTSFCLSVEVMKL